MAQRRALWEYYLILGLDPGASTARIKQAYRTLVKRWHPDQFNHDRRMQQLAEEKLKEINEAYSALSDSGRSANHRRGYPRYSRPSAGQQARGYSRTNFTNDWQSSGQQEWEQYWKTATGGPFKYQSSYYRARQAKAAGSRATSSGDSYTSTYAAYTAATAQDKPRMPRWAIMLVMVSIMGMMNSLSSSMLNSSSNSYAASAAQPADSSWREFTNVIPIVPVNQKALEEQRRQVSLAAAAAWRDVKVKYPPVKLKLSDKEIVKWQHELELQRNSALGTEKTRDTTNPPVYRWKNNPAAAGDWPRSKLHLGTPAGQKTDFNLSKPQNLPPQGKD